MYGYRQATNENGLMTNLNSISSSLSSIDTIGRRTNTKASNDNLITSRTHSIASTSLLWKGNGIGGVGNQPKEDRYSSASIRNGIGRLGHTTGSEIYYNGTSTRTMLTNYCFKSETALNLILVPLLLLTIVRQVFDFLGQIWLQILINFFTIIIIIVAVFGIRQHRIFYLSLFAFWALLNTVWNIIVFCIHTKIRDVGVNEDVLSFYTGATSWWQTNGPGCLPYNISSIHTSISILQPNIITGCRLDYHHIESTQAVLHALLSLVAALICCCVISNIRKSPAYKSKNKHKSDEPYRLNNLVNHDRSKVNQDPFPKHASSRFGATSNSASLRRSTNKVSSRSSQHSVGSTRSARRRHQSTDGATPRGSVSSTQRSQKYGSLSSRRSHNVLRERRGEISSLTYGTTGDRVGPMAGPSNQRTRLSSLSSVDYLPSYQPPHSSNANLLSSYGEISSIESYNNHYGQRGSKKRQTSVKSSSKGNFNPTYTGSRSSVCSHNTNNANNYDDLSYIYGNNNTKNNESLYGASSSNGASGGPIANDRGRYQQNSQAQNRTNSIGKRDGIRDREKHNIVPQRIQAEAHQLDKSYPTYQNSGDVMTKGKYNMTNGSFQSFTTAPLNGATVNPSSKSQMNEESRLVEINNNHINSNSNQHDIFDIRGQSNNDEYISNGRNSSSDLRSRPTMDGLSNMGPVIPHKSNQAYSRHPIYSNHTTNGNSETPI